MNEPARRTRHRSAIRDDSAQRRADVTLILAVVNATRTWEDQTGRTAPVKPLRELLWTVWEQPRLPRPVYPGQVPAVGPLDAGGTSRLRRPHGSAVDRARDAGRGVRAPPPRSAAFDQRRLRPCAQHHHLRRGGSGGQPAAGRRWCRGQAGTGFGRSARSLPPGRARPGDVPSHRGGAADTADSQSAVVRCPAG